MGQAQGKPPEIWNRGNIMGYSINSSDLADTTSVGEWNGREADVVRKYNKMLEMLADKIPDEDVAAWHDATHYLWDLVGSDEYLPDYTEDQMQAAINKAA
jgi:hypothetical protein